MSFVNWVIDSMASDEVIDLYFILSDLVEVNLTEKEIYESACYDSLANAAIREHRDDRKTPIGRQVL